MFFPLFGKTAIVIIDTADILINKNALFLYEYCNKFKYIRTEFTLSLKDNLEIHQQLT